MSGMSGMNGMSGYTIGPNAIGAKAMGGNAKCGCGQDVNVKVTNGSGYSTGPTPCQSSCQTTPLF